MAIEIIIRQKGFFHKVPLELEDLTDGHLEYGVMDFGYRLVPRERHLKSPIQKMKFLKSFVRRASM